MVSGWGSGQAGVLGQHAQAQQHKSSSSSPWAGLGVCNSSTPRATQLTWEEDQHRAGVLGLVNVRHQRLQQIKVDSILIKDGQVAPHARAARGAVGWVGGVRVSKRLHRTATPDPHTHPRARL